ncbi:hypothetical protein GCM10023340_09870 [Nocardioides marinquilinus]|uniref:Uncharacterized protein n=1 Tax=Nocardioides marinquilinus TaxID=1210400 RepID=A0ABP9PHK0_9ACTN
MLPRYGGVSVLRAEHDHGGDDDGSHGQAHAEGAVPPGQRVRTIEPFGDVTAVPCDDTGCTTHPSDYDTRRAWTVPGFDPDEVLAVRSGLAPSRSSSRTRWTRTRPGASST